MNSAEMIANLKANEKLEGLNIMEIARYNQVIVSNFGNTPDWREAKAELESLGFECGPNSGQWDGEHEQPPSIREQYEQMTEAEKAQADATFERMARG